MISGKVCTAVPMHTFSYITQGTGIKGEFIMAHKVSDACIGCGACEGACPVGAVAVENGVAVVNADVCIDCGACHWCNHC